MPILVKVWSSDSGEGDEKCEKFTCKINYDRQQSNFEKLIWIQVSYKQKKKQSKTSQTQEILERIKVFASHVHVQLTPAY